MTKQLLNIGCAHSRQQSPDFGCWDGRLLAGLPHFFRNQNLCDPMNCAIKSLLCSRFPQHVIRSQDHSADASSDHWKYRSFGNFFQFVRLNKCRHLIEVQHVGNWWAITAQHLTIKVLPSAFCSMCSKNQESRTIQKPCVVFICTRDHGPSARFLTNMLIPSLMTSPYKYLNNPHVSPMPLLWAPDDTRLLYAEDVVFTWTTSRMTVTLEKSSIPVDPKSTTINDAIKTSIDH